MWQSLNKIIEKEENLLFKTKKLFSLLTQPKQKIQKLSLFLTLLFFLLLHSPLKPQQSSNLWCSFLLQIAKEGHFRGREVRGSEWDFENSGLGGLLSPLIFLGRIDGDPVLRETRIWATWEYVSSVGGGQQGMVGLCAHCGCGKLVVHHRPTAT
ncbi:hypothetical protein GmHk_16G046525 [Glycine max]|nr:hypothetical protein GmHk_16G046525 [Glycine max]